MERIEYQEHLAKLPASTRVIHIVLNYLKVVGFGLVLGIFIQAVIVSINWKTVNPLEIGFWWILFASLGGLPGMLIVGLDAVLIRAIAPLPFGRGADRLTTGKKAVITGILIIIGGLIWNSIWVGIGYGVWTNQYNIVEIMVNVLANLVAIVIVISIFTNIFRKLLKKNIHPRIGEEESPKT